MIHGELAPARREGPRGFVARLLGRPAPPRESALGDGRWFVEYAPGELDGMARGFRDWLGRALPAPWPATRAALEYLDLGVTTVFLRGERSGDAPPSVYVQLGFSGCAGMAQTSADLAAHWAERWFASERERIDGQWLHPRGFAATRAEVVAESARFLPLGGSVGHAGWSPPVAGVPGLFAVDDALAESAGPQADALLAALADRFAVPMGDGRCRCQLCLPGFDLATLDDLPRID